MSILSSLAQEIIFTSSLFSNNLSNRIIDAEWFSDLIPILNSKANNELLKENVLDYRKEGKNKIFFIRNTLKAKNYVYSAEIHKLNSLLKKHPELSIILDDIKKDFSKGMIILFGSYAKGIPKKESDIDIYLETKDNNIKTKVKNINSKLSIKIGKFDTKSLLIKEIIKNHIIIRGLEDFYERVEFFKEA